MNAKSHLQQDPILASLIKSYELQPIDLSQNLFVDLLESIVGQQLSVKAANTIFKRFLTLLPNQVPSPENILKLSDDQLRSCGLSRQKLSYLKSLSQAILSGDLVLDTLPLVTDEEVILHLTKVKGIGKWTAEMFLIFSLARPDVFSLGDLGLRNAISKLYGLDRNNLIEITKLSQHWQPYRSLASRYLWHSLENT